MHADILSNQVLAESSDALDSQDNPVDSLARFAASSGASLTTELLGTSSGKSISRPKCLLGESLRKGDGVGNVIALDEYRCKLLVVTLGITDVVERTGLTVSIWGSSDQNEWGAKPLVTF